MLSLSAVAKAEKNNLNSDGVFVILMELNLPMKDVDPIRVCRNTEDIEWNGHTWQAFPFELGKVSEDKSGSIPSFEIRIDNTSQALTYYVEASNGANNGEVVFYIVNTKALTVTTAEVEEHYRITKLTVTEQWVTATVGTSYNPHSRRPEGKYVKNSCRYKEFAGPECGYKGTAYTSCNRTLSDCRARGCSKRFGGFPGVDQGGIYV
ncbi:hypothetical protein [uncultured Megasphaera sp.]|uniref:hypothetical protein n=1 Tax=uncultured Megasphaera sp. TaxID=165188 RepID=UPI0025843850|nr:hypothetical protein [uncultured Megasphaera sp.]